MIYYFSLMRLPFEFMLPYNYDISSQQKRCFNVRPHTEKLQGNNGESIVSVKSLILYADKIHDER